MAKLSDFITEIATGEYGQDIVNYGKDSNGDFQPFKADINGNQYVIDEQLATKLDTLIAKDFATETTLNTRLSSLETKMDTLLNSQDVDDNIKVSQNGSIVEEQSDTFSFSSNGEYITISTFDVSKYKSIEFFAKNSQDCNIILSYIQVGIDSISAATRSNLNFYDEATDSWIGVDETFDLIIPPNSVSVPNVYDLSSLEYINKVTSKNPINFNLIRLRFKSSGTPTEGSTTITLRGAIR